MSRKFLIKMADKYHSVILRIEKSNINNLSELEMVNGSLFILTKTTISQINVSRLSKTHKAPLA